MHFQNKIRMNDFQNKPRTLSCLPYSVSKFESYNKFHADRPTFATEM